MVSIAVVPCGDPAVWTIGGGCAGRARSAVRVNDTPVTYLISSTRSSPQPRGEPDEFDMELEDDDFDFDEDMEF